MKVTITTLKAPWPKGAKVGDVVAFEGPVPAWAAGKCQPAADDAEVDHKYKSPVIGGDVGAVEPAAQHAAEAQAFIDSMRTKHGEEVAALRQQIEDGGRTLQEALDANQVLGGELATAKADADAQRAQVTELQAKLAAAEAAAPKVGKK